MLYFGSFLLLVLVQLFLFVCFFLFFRHGTRFIVRFVFDTFCEIYFFFVLPNCVLVNKELLNVLC